MPVTVVVKGVVAGHRDQAAKGWPQGVEYLRGRIRPHLVRVNHWSFAKIKPSRIKVGFTVYEPKRYLNGAVYIFQCVKSENSVFLP